MSMVLSTVSAIQLCAGCALEFETRVTLGSRDDPAGPGFFAEVLDVGDQGYLVSSEVLGGVVLVYDSEGRYQRELTREGEGPGELSGQPRFASGPGGVIMLEPGSPRVHLFSRELEFIRTFLIPGVSVVWSVRSDPATGGWLAGYLGEDFVETGVLLLDQEGNVVRSIQAGEGADSVRGWQSVIRGTDGMIWRAALFGRVELLDEDLALLGSIQLELPGMEGWEPPREGGGGWLAQVNDIRLAPDGSGLWVFAMAPEEKLAALSVEELRDEIVANAGAVEQVADAYVYWVRMDPDGLTVVGMDNFDTLVRPLGDEDLAFDLFETPDGNRRARVGRLRLTRTAPDTPDS